MKVILPVMVLAALSVYGTSQANSTTPKTCDNTTNCFYLDNEQLLPTGEFNDYPSYASLSNRFHTGGERAFVFSPRYKQWAAYDRDGYLVANGVANGGKDYCADIGRACRTPGGSYRIGRKGSAACVSNKYPLGVGGAAMPYCMFFKGGYAIHGSPYISNRNGSHGCIRVRTHHARWLHRHFLRPGTKVIVLSY